LLDDPARRALYEYVVAQQHDVGRNEAAQAVGIQRTLAAFHLDRLAAAGLLDVTFRRVGGRTGPGAGRPAKLYGRAAKELTYSAPPRDYALAAAILAEAIEDAGVEPSVHAAARRRGVIAGRTLASRRLAGGVSLDTLLAELAERGYAPYGTHAQVRLRNCPFRQVAHAFAPIACGMNLALLEGVLHGAGLDADYAARLDLQPAECCVVIQSKVNEY
jgi:predicted ArsR family transcriptional regulator